MVDYNTVPRYLPLSVSVQMCLYDLLQPIKYEQKSHVSPLVEALGSAHGLLCFLSLCHKTSDVPGGGCLGPGEHEDHV